jgi:hypothetical protein
LIPHVRWSHPANQQNLQRYRQLAGRHGLGKIVLNVAAP